MGDLMHLSLFRHIDVQQVYECDQTFVLLLLLFTIATHACITNYYVCILCLQTGSG